MAVKAIHVAILCYCSWIVQAHLNTSESEIVTFAEYKGNVYNPGYGTGFLPSSPIRYLYRIESEEGYVSTDLQTSLPISYHMFQQFTILEN